MLRRLALQLVLQIVQFYIEATKLVDARLVLQAHLHVVVIFHWLRKRQGGWHAMRTATRGDPHVVYAGTLARRAACRQRTIVILGSGR